MHHERGFVLVDGWGHNLALHPGCGPREDAVAPPALSAVADAGTPRAATEKCAGFQRVCQSAKAEGATLVEVPAQVLGSATQRAEVMPRFVPLSCRCRLNPDSRSRQNPACGCANAGSGARRGVRTWQRGCGKRLLQRQQQLSRAARVWRDFRTLPKPPHRYRKRAPPKRSAVDVTGSRSVGSRCCRDLPMVGGRVTLRSPLCRGGDAGQRRDRSNRRTRQQSSHLCASRQQRKPASKPTARLE